MIVTIELDVENCEQCPYFQYEGESYSESVYICTKTRNEVNPIGIPCDCPFIETTINKLRSKV